MKTQNILAAIKSRLATTFGKAMLSVVISTIILSFPWLLSWMDDGFEKVVMDACYTIRNLALPIILMFAKSFTETGGTKPLTHEAENRVQ